MHFAGTTREVAPPLPLAGEADASRAMRSIVPSAAGEGSHRTGIASAILDNPDAEAPPTPALPRKREREPTADAEALFTPYAIALPWRGRVGSH